MLARWAASDDLQDWRRVAALLQGAYEVEIEELGKAIDLASRSQVLRQINSWVKESHASAKRKLGCAAAYAYGLIGQESPEQALQGLKQLLRFPQDKDDNNKVNFPPGCICCWRSGLCYTHLVWAYPCGAGSLGS